MMSLHALLAHKRVVLQCHDNPDADTIACAFGLGRFFSLHDIPVKMVYAGFGQITKPNLIGFVSGLSIPLEFIGKTARTAVELAGGEEIRCW